MRTTLYLLPGRQPIAGPNNARARELIRQAQDEIRMDPQERQRVIDRLEEFGFAQPRR